ncbi:MAG: glycerophosphodiester phosphodiesterase [Bryobacteraceae bacterium]|nr:glycerophosphodiester phosphodiesterase [Bryobacteraceae bacterium]
MSLRTVRAIRLCSFAWLLSCSLSLAAEPSQSIVVHGHRGARASRPENTISAFQFAIAAGAHVLELDLAVTKDKILVVSHFPAINTGTATYPGERVCKGPATRLPIYMLTLAQVREYDCGSNVLKEFPEQVAEPGSKIPTFEEVLDLAKGNNIEFNVETKIFPNHPELTPSPEEFVRLILELVRKRQLESRVMLQSFDFRTLRAMKQQEPAIRRVALFGLPKYDSLMGITDPDKDFVSIATKSGANILSPTMELVTPDSVKAAHSAGLAVVPYTVNKPEDWQTMVDAGVDGIITDDPAGLITWLKLNRRK